MKKLAATILAIASIFLTMYGLKGSLAADHIRLANRFYAVFLLIGAAFFVLGILCLVYGLGKGASRSLTKIRDEADYDCRPAQRGELKELYAFNRTYFGEDVPHFEKFLKWFDKNPEIFFVLMHETGRPLNRRTHLVGCFRIIPLTEKTAAMVKNESLNAIGFEPEHIVRIGGNATAWYLGGAAGDSRESKALVLAHMKERVRAAKGQGVRFVFARPTTSRGLRAVLNKGFSLVGPPYQDQLGRIYVLDLERSPHLISLS